MALLLTGVAEGSDEVHVFAAEDYATCCASCGVTPWHNDTAAAVYNVFSALISAGGWDVARSSIDSALDGMDWTDSEEETWGADSVTPWGADAADVAFLFTHGNSVC